MVYEISAAYTSSLFINLQTATFRSRCVCDEGCSSSSKTSGSGLSIGSILLIVYVLNMGRSVRPCRYGDTQEFREHAVEESSFFRARLKLNSPYKYASFELFKLYAFIHTSIGAR